MLSEIAHSVLFPVVTDLAPHDWLLDFISRGGRSVLFGETGEEYRAGVMSDDRVAVETADLWRMVTGRLTQVAGPLLLALDADISAVHRLHRLTPPMPTLGAAQSMSTEALEEAIYRIACAAKHLGVNLLLSPTADVVTGRNDWLLGRTLGNDHETAARLVRAYVRGVRRAGIAATLKHFPGHPVLDGNPATEIAHVPLDMPALRDQLGPFVAGLDAGAQAIMMGPAIFDAVEPPLAGSISSQLIALARQDLGFKGLMMTCDIDHRSTMLDRGIVETAILALEAGADLLLLSPRAVPQIAAIAAGIVAAVESGRLPVRRLEDANAAIRNLIAEIA